MDEIAEQLGRSRPRALQMYLCRCNTWKMEGLSGWWWRACAVVRVRCSSG